MKTWFGVIIVAFKTDPLQILILENKQTGNITLPSGALENSESTEQAAVRELQEEVGWQINSHDLQATEFKQEFIYGSQKKERSGDRGINQLLILNADNLPDPIETSETKNAKWVTLQEAEKLITFEDLKEVLRQGVKHI